MERRRDDLPDDFQVIRAVLACRRRLGEPFEVAWSVALSVLDRPMPSAADAHDRDMTLTALARTQEDWRRGYERLPPRPAPYPMVALDVRADVAA